ncbi:MAG: PEP-CTERM sorting domain-containing protein [Candidatus Poribacteria bacterium]
MTFDSHIGEFDVMNGLALGGGLFFDPIFSDTDLTLVTQQSEPIPEPTTICLMGFGILGLLAIGIRQRRKNQDA